MKGFSLPLRNWIDTFDHEGRLNGGLLLVGGPEYQLAAHGHDSWQKEYGRLRRLRNSHRTYLFIILIRNIPFRQTCLSLTILSISAIDHVAGQHSLLGQGWTWSWWKNRKEWKKEVEWDSRLLISRGPCSMYLSGVITTYRVRAGSLPILTVKMPMYSAG